MMERLPLGIRAQGGNGEELPESNSEAKIMGRTFSPEILG